MITERLFCVKLCEAGFWLHPGAAPHPKEHNDWQRQDDRQGEIENGSGCPGLQVAKGFKKIHAEIPGKKCQGHKQYRDDGQGLHNLVHAVVH